MIKHLTIFEGPDGSGKSTTARAYAHLTGGRYVHHGPYLKIKTTLGRLYVESFTPALLGYDHVVLDRSWISEAPYGYAMRNGVRLEAEDLRTIERYAWRVNPVVVLCLPPQTTCLKYFSERHGRKAEYLADVKKFKYVYNWYATKLNVALPTFNYDHTSQVEFATLVTTIDAMRELTDPFPTAVDGGGRFNAPVIIVGEAYGSRRDVDPFPRVPFSGFHGGGCGAWLTRQLEDAKIAEARLAWANADQDLTWVFDAFDRRKISVVALGDAAKAKLETLQPYDVPHPQYWKRFHAGKPYPLIGLLRRLLRQEIAK